MVNQAIKTKEIHSNYIKKLVAQSGPEEYDYKSLDNWFKEVWRFSKEGIYTKEDITELRQMMGHIYTNTASLVGQVYIAPYGYKGDFEVIDRIYRKHVSTDPTLSKWDIYFQQTAATKAVRNRKTYFKNLLASKSGNNNPMTVLNLASGPCRDLKEFYDENPLTSKQVTIDCVELDPKAIEFASELLGTNPNVRFIQKNIFKFSTEKKYPLIWSAGLFDYFDDKTFVRILARFLKNIEKGGEIVIGNFHPRNTTRAFMESGEWYLHHRTNEELIALAEQAGVRDRNRIRIEEEAEGVNLFMRIGS